MALMADLEKAKNVLRTLASGVSCPVTCKVRVLPEIEATVEVCKTLADTGIAAIGVHGRTRDERPQHGNRNHYIRAVAEALSIPVIAKYVIALLILRLTVVIGRLAKLFYLFSFLFSGGSKEILCFEDIEKFRADTGCSSVMVARAAEWNVSIFRKEGLLPLDDIIKKYLTLSVDYDNNGSNSKYCVQNMLRELQETPRGKVFLEAQTLEQIWLVVFKRDIFV